MLAALATARRALPEYAHRYSPRKFTQHQLFACLVLKNFLRTDYCGLAAHLEDHPSLLALLELKQVPHFTTFQKAAHRLLLTAPARQLLESTVRLHLGRRRRVKRAAIDSTGLECSCASGYFVRRPTDRAPRLACSAALYPNRRRGSSCSRGLWRCSLVAAVVRQFAVTSDVCCSRRQESSRRASGLHSSWPTTVAANRVLDSRFSGIIRLEAEAVAAALLLCHSLLLRLAAGR